MLNSAKILQIKALISTQAAYLKNVKESLDKAVVAVSRIKFDSLFKLILDQTDIGVDPGTCTYCGEFQPNMRNASNMNKHILKYHPEHAPAAKKQKLNKVNNEIDQPQEIVEQALQQAISSVQ